ncbi:MAG: D-alanyl-D-alanine carboxypeptidase [Rhodospirillales bacterium]|jgi:D-alanyl-D-alanine carboxypeptidase (penicillin-binding protein 5/6)|nr:D-alanyl-D-alanine carboxypeptidase [Rhodospirillales bacterium]
MTGAFLPAVVRRIIAAGVIAGVSILAAAPASAIETAAKHAFLVDATTDVVLFNKAGDEAMPPASMSKIMTTYLVFKRLRDGTLKLDDELPVSEYAWRVGGAASGGSTMFLKLGDRVKVSDLLKGIIIQSGNDACIVIAEGLAGSEIAFAEEMTRVGKQIGLTNSVFRNSTGLPDPDEYMTARDLATLSQRIIEDFPEYYPMFSEKHFVFNGIKQGNRNPLLYKGIGADGLKTGHTQAAGYGLTASAVQGDRRLILVVNGLPSMKARADETERLLDYGFREFDNYVLFKPGEPVANAEVWLGEEATVPLVVAGGAVATLARKARPNMKVTVAYDGPIEAPIAKGQTVGTLQVTAPGTEPIEFPLVADASVDRLGLFGRLMAALGHVVRGIFG